MGDTAYSRLRAFLRIARPAVPEAFDDLDALANALRSIATIIGCPANADPLTDLDGLVMMVRGLAERAETVRVVTADRDALQKADLTHRLELAHAVDTDCDDWESLTTIARVNAGYHAGLAKALDKGVGEGASWNSMIADVAALRVDMDARIADAVAADRAAFGAWLRDRPGIAYLAHAIEHGDHIDDDKPPLPSLRMTLLLRDELLRQVETLTAERDRRVDPVEHARAVMDGFTRALDTQAPDHDKAATLCFCAWCRWDVSDERATLLARVGADVLAEVER